MITIKEAERLLKNRNKAECDFETHHLLREIEENVKKNGDSALYELTEKFDGAKLENLYASKDEIDGAEISKELQNAIKMAYENIKKFHVEHLTGLQNQKKVETTQGVWCWRKFTPIEKVGIYVPAGSAPLFSTVLMTAIPAQIAGCKEVILATPPQKDGTIHPAILWTAKLCGVQKILKCGGGQAVFAMAYGTESVSKVSKIFGPGNKFVDGAKKMVQHSVAIDMPAGPSEVMVVCDANANAKIVASDVLSQLEHDPFANSVVVCSSKNLLTEIDKEVKNGVLSSKRREILEKSIKNFHLIFVENLKDSLPFINNFAPEHLILNIEGPYQFAEGLVNAGSVFVGKYSAESIGDYASGTNHTLPTNGFAKAFSGLGVESFGKFITFQEVLHQGFENIAKAVQIMAEEEGLFEHANAISVRGLV